MSIIYLLSIIGSYLIWNHIDKKESKIINERGYQFGPRMYKIGRLFTEYCAEATAILFPGLNLIISSLILLEGDSIINSVVDDLIADGGLIKKPDEVEEEDVNTSEERLIINNILASKDLEEDIPKWKKTISSMYYGLGNLLKKHNIIEDEPHEVESIVDEAIKVKSYK